MFRHQDALYKNGPLALVWSVGNKGVKKGRSRLLTVVRKADLLLMCDQLIKLFNSQPLEDNNGLDLKAFSILVLGINTIQKYQLADIQRQLDVLYNKCRWRMPVMFDLQIDLPRPKKPHHGISLNMTQQEQQGFGEMFIHDADLADFRDMNTSQARNDEAEISTLVPEEQSALEEEMDVSLDIEEIIRRQKDEQRKSRRNAEKIEKARNAEDVDLLRMLQDRLTKSMSLAQNITLVEEAPVPQNLNEFGNFFGDFDGDQVAVEQNMDNIMEVETTIDFPTVTSTINQTTPTRPINESDAIPLALRIQQDTPSTPPPNTPRVDHYGPSMNKRRRMYWHKSDDKTELGGSHIRRNLEESQLTDAEIRELLDIRVAPLRAPKNTFPIMFGTVAQTLKGLRQFLGRPPGNHLTETVTGIQQGQLNLTAEEQRREVSAAADDDVSRALQAEQGDINVTGQPGHCSPTLEPPITATSAVEELPPVDLPPMESFEQMQDQTFVAEEQSTVHESTVQQERDTIFQDSGKYFHDYFPPATTTKAKAALEFHRLLKLQASGVVRLEQHEHFGPIKITLLKPLA